MQHKLRGKRNFSCPAANDNSSSMRKRDSKTKIDQFKTLQKCNQTHNRVRILLAKMQGEKEKEYQNQILQSQPEPIYKKQIKSMTSEFDFTVSIPERDVDEILMEKKMKTQQQQYYSYQKRKQKLGNPICYLVQKYHDLLNLNEQNFSQRMKQIYDQYVSKEFIEFERPKTQKSQRDDQSSERILNWITTTKEVFRKGSRTKQQKFQLNFMY